MPSKNSAVAAGSRAVIWRIRRDSNESDTRELLAVIPSRPPGSWHESIRFNQITKQTQMKSTGPGTLCRGAGGGEVPRGPPGCPGCPETADAISLSKLG